MSNIVIGTFFGTAFMFTMIISKLQSKSKKSIGTQTFNNGIKNVETQTFEEPEFSEGVFMYDSGMSTTSGSFGGSTGGSTGGSIVYDNESIYWDMRMVVEGLINENLFYE